MTTNGVDLPQMGASQSVPRSEGDLMLHCSWLAASEMLLDNSSLFLYGVNSNKLRLK